MATIPKDVKAALIARLNSAYGGAELICDGYRINLEVRRVSETSLRYAVCVFVNGVWKGDWCQERYTGPEQKFARRVERPLHTPSERAQLLKAGPAYGRKGSAERREFEAGVNTTYVIYEPVFSSGRAAINHLLRVSETVAVPEEMLPATAEAPAA